MINDPQKMRDYRRKMNDRILSENYLPIKRFFNLDTQAYQEGSLDESTKELMGLVASTVMRCNDCIFYHLDNCIQKGVTKSQIIEALNIALIVGGSIVIPHLRFAFEAMDELYESKN